MRRSPPESVPTLCLSSCARGGKICSIRSRRFLRSRHALAAVRAGVEVLAHREPREDVVALRRQRDAALDDRRRPPAGAVHAAPADLRAVQPDRAGLPAGQADDRLQQGRLAVPVEADQPHRLAPLDLEVEVVQHAAAARSRRIARGSQAAGSRSGGLRSDLEVGGADHRLVEDGLRRSLRDDPTDVEHDHASTPRARATRGGAPR